MIFLSGRQDSWQEFIGWVTLVYVFLSILSKPKEISCFDCGYYKWVYVVPAVIGTRYTERFIISISSPSNRLNFPSTGNNTTEST